MVKKLIDGVNIEYEIIGSGTPILALMPGARRGCLEMKSKDVYSQGGFLLKG